MTFFDIFAGIGGFRLAMEQAGHKCIAYCEFDKYAVESYKSMHDTENEVYFKDVRTIDPDSIPRCEIWCFGFPCQDVSVAGKQKGTRVGTRSGLFYAVTRLIELQKEENKPRYLIIENVKNLLSINGGFDFARILIEMDKIGYDAEWDVLDTAEVLPQHRERVFIIGHLRGACTQKIFPIQKTCETTNDLQRQICNTITTRYAEGQAGGAYLAQSKQFPKVEQLNQQQINGRQTYQQDRVYSINGASPSLSTMSSGGNLQPEIAIPCLTPNRIEKRQNGRRFKTNGEPAFTLTSQDRHGVAIAKGLYTGDSIAFHKKPLDEVSRCLKANKHDTGVILNDCNIRKLTPLECFRLQGFPDEYFYKAMFLNKEVAKNFIKYFGNRNSKKVNAIKIQLQKQKDNQLYKQIGNSVSVPVVYEIAKRIP